MQNPRFIPPFTLDRTASPLSLAYPAANSPMSAPARPTEGSFPYFSGKKDQSKPRNFWKSFTRKASKLDGLRSANPFSKSTTALDDVPVRKHKSTPDFKKLRPTAKANPSCAPCRDLPPALPTAPSTGYFSRTPRRDLTDNPTIILVLDDKWDSSSIDFPLRRLQQTVPVDITEEESSEAASHPNTHSQYTPQHHPIRGQRRRAETGKSNREMWFKKRTHDPNASFLIMDVKNKSKPF